MLASSDAARGALTGALAGVDRLVVLGDVLELRHGPLRDALAGARPVLRALAAALPAQAEVVIVPGNHDHHLLAGWLERRARDGVPAPLALENAVDWRRGEALATMAGWLGPARVRVAYPGVWLRDDVYATHGHYLDRHTTVPTFERLGAGLMAAVVHDRFDGPRRVEDYERALAPLYEWLNALAQRGDPELGASSHGASARAWRALARSDGRAGWRRWLLIAGFPALIGALNLAGLGPLTPDLSGSALRRGPLFGLGEALDRLQVGAPHVIFGHTHRAGPLPGDRPDEWRAATGSVLLNTGSWVRGERGFLGPRPAESPYRPGFCAWLQDDGPPELRCLLDEVAPSVWGSAS